ncbi:hypothetical protein GT022_12320 [Agaribacter marinus]|uniref:Uncharacterized protein n=1 Tax=Virgibacillus salarius TaxID=447199 RepID=A0A941ID62_9BACI|nr:MULTISPECIES: hypothetical protein [Bacillaceae]MBR7796830.1 hypothetical protein [Virgibacillus salarius]NAZ09540.1 hypothetical protein [Agaribacter marinus]WBX81380.1 hypothetical protein PD280_06595 [Virgibacillus salarius]
MIYFDQAASSYPKPPVVIEAMMRVMNEIGAIPKRGGILWYKGELKPLIHGGMGSHSEEVLQPNGWWKYMKVVR